MRRAVQSVVSLGEPESLGKSTVIDSSEFAAGDGIHSGGPT